MEKEALDKLIELINVFGKQVVTASMWPPPLKSPNT